MPSYSVDTRIEQAADLAKSDADNPRGLVRAICAVAIAIGVLAEGLKDVRIEAAVREQD